MLKVAVRLPADPTMVVMRIATLTSVVTGLGEACGVTMRISVPSLLTDSTCAG